MIRDFLLNAKGRLVYYLQIGSALGVLVLSVLLTAPLVSAPLLAAQSDPNVMEHSDVFRIHLPAVVNVYPSILFEQVWAADENGEPRKAFIPGENVQIAAGGQNSANNDIPAILTWSAVDPCGETFSGSHPVVLESGNWIVSQQLEGSDCEGIYTFSIQLEYQNQNTTMDSLYVVTEPSDLVFQDGQAFDKCNVASVSEMQTWWDNSPYIGTNLYIGGISRYCANTELDASWVYQVSQQGWSFIPTWVGPQAPCSNFKFRMSWDPDIAYQQGHLNADAANQVLLDLGFLGERIVYYDVEGYSTNSGLEACREAVNWFLKGWTERLNELGTESGAYGSPRRSYVSDWDEIDPKPHYVWLAAWKWPYEYDPDVTVWGLDYLSDDLWADQQRIRQYAGDHYETYGGVTFHIDSNVVESDITIFPDDPLVDHPLAGATLGSIPPRRVIEGMGLLTNETGWLVGNQRLIWTRDGGESWVDVTPEQSVDEHILAVFFLDENLGWLVSTGEAAKLRLYTTTDGGGTWQGSALHLQSELADMIYAAQVHFIDQQHGWISFKFKTSRNFSIGKLLKTRDGGTTWVEYSQPVGGSIHFINEDQGWLKGGPNDDAEYVTGDGGETWMRLEDKTQDAHSHVWWSGKPSQGTSLTNLPDGTQNVVFADGQIGWVYVRYSECRGDKGRLANLGMKESQLVQCEVFDRLMKTEDGGQTWVKMELGELWD